MIARLSIQSGGQQIKKEKEISFDEKVNAAWNRARRLKRLKEINAPEKILEKEWAAFYAAAEAVFFTEGK